MEVFHFMALDKVEIAFRVGMSLSTKIDNRKKDILTLGKCPTQGLEQTMSAETMYFDYFTENFKKFCLSLHYNGANSYLFVNSKEIHKFKAKNSEIAATPLCLANISKEWTVGNMKKTGLNGYVYDFSVNFNAFSSTVGMQCIHKYLMAKNIVIQNV